MMTITSVILNIVNAVLTVYMFNLFFSSFAKQRTKKRVHICGSICIATIFTLTLCFVDNRIFNVAIMLCLTIVLSQFFSFKWYSGVLLSFLGYALGTLAELVSAALLSLLFTVDVKSATEGAYYMVGFLLSKFITFLIISFIRVKKKNVLFLESPRRLLVIILIPCSTLVILIIQYYYFMMIPYTETVTSLPALLCYVFLISSNMVVLDLLEHLYQDAEKESQLEFAKKLLRSQSDQYQQLLDHNKSILKLRHDHKNFLLGLISEIKNNNIDAVLESLNNQCEALKLPYNGASPSGIIGTIVNAKNSLAQSKGIEIDFSHSELQKIQISEIDMAIILGNALDNAIEALDKVHTAESKIVSLLIRVHNNQIVIVIKNQTHEEVDTENLKTSKKNSTQHGFGILSIKNLVDKYNGEVAFSCVDKIFQVHITMNNRKFE